MARITYPEQIRPGTPISYDDMAAMLIAMPADYLFAAQVQPQPMQTHPAAGPVRILYDGYRELSAAAKQHPDYPAYRKLSRRNNILGLMNVVGSASFFTLAANQAPAADTLFDKVVVGAGILAGIATATSALLLERQRSAADRRITRDVLATTGQAVKARAAQRTSEWFRRTYW